MFWWWCGFSFGWKYDILKKMFLSERGLVMSAVLLKNCNLIDETGVITAGEDLLIREGVIAARGTGLSLAEGEAGEALDCSGLFVSPGFTILHAHSPMHILRGVAEDVNVNDWFNREIWPYESKIQEEDIYWGAKLCCAEMLDHGVTAFADHYFHGEQIARAAKESGIRADIAGTVFAFDGNPEPEMKAVEALMDQYQGDPMVKLRFGPHSPYICSPEVLRTLVEAAREKGGGVHLHVSETADQVAESRKKHGKTPVEVAAEAGCFTVPCIIAHGLWMEEGDLPLLAEDTYIAHCPKTYLKLGAGKGTIWDFWRRVNLCIGTDGAASSNSVDPLEQARLFALVGKFDDKAEDYPLREVWQVLMRGHEALGFGSGRLAAGAAADLLFWDLNMVHTAPLYNPLAAILYSGDSRNIRHVMVAGEFRKRDGALVFDTASILENGARCAREISLRGKGVSKLHFG